MIRPVSLRLRTKCLRRLDQNSSRVVRFLALLLISALSGACASVVDGQLKGQQAAIRYLSAEFDKAIERVEPADSRVGGSVLYVAPTLEAVARGASDVLPKNPEQRRLWTEFYLSAMEASYEALLRREAFDRVTLIHAQDPGATKFGSYDFVVYVDVSGPSPKPIFLKARGQTPVEVKFPKLDNQGDGVNSLEIFADRVAELALASRPSIVRPIARLNNQRAVEEGAAEGRVALVVGNSRYENITRLDNPNHDASAVGDKLKTLGFEVTLLTDTDSASMKTGIREFRRRLKNARLSLFYFSGHAVQVDGENFLLPIDAQIEEETDLAYDAIALSSILAEMETATNTRIVILDACRDNPFVAQLASRMPQRRSVGVTRGLAITRRSAVGTLIAYATSPNAVAADGDGVNSPYTTALLNWIGQPELEIGEVFRRVREDVVRITNGAQVPWENSSLVGDGVYLAPR